MDKTDQNLEAVSISIHNIVTNLECATRLMFMFYLHSSEIERLGY